MDLLFSDCSFFTLITIIFLGNVAVFHVLFKLNSICCVIVLSKFYGSSTRVIFFCSLSLFFQWLLAPPRESPASLHSGDREPGAKRRAGRPGGVRASAGAKTRIPVWVTSPRTEL